jgi:tetratricopeptide (TPR) repeat protein
LSAVLRAFKAADGNSKVLVTNRYRFTLPDGRKRDLADLLDPVQLPSMTEKERAKQWRAARRTRQDEPETVLGAEENAAEHLLVDQILETAGGNPGLQEILSRPLLGGELKAAEEALYAVIRWKTSGRVPHHENAVQEFFQRVSFEVYGRALTNTQLTQLRAATLFEENLPIPRPALAAVGAAAGINDPKVALDRLIALGLMDLWDEFNGVLHLSANPLARPLVKQKLSPKEQTHLAGAALLPLADAWQDADGNFPFDPRGVAAARLALMGRAPAAFLEKAAVAAGWFLFEREHNAKAASEILTAALAQLDGADFQPTSYFFRLSAKCAQRIGEIRTQINLLKRGLELQSEDKTDRAKITVELASATMAENPQEALETLTEAANLFQQEKDKHSYAVTMGKIADILAQRGDTDEALRIRYEEELPVYERLNEVREKAVTMGKIADILAQRGDTDEALRIRYEEELPVYERLNEVREKAVTMGKIADILAQRGDIDEALRIHIEERLPVAKKIKDMDSIAHIRFSCAEIRLNRGGLEEEAQTIYEELLESFATFSEIQRMDGIAYVGRMLGQVLVMAKIFDDAYRVLDQSAAAFKKLRQPRQAEEIRNLQKQVKEQMS